VHIRLLMVNGFRLMTLAEVLSATLGMDPKTPVAQLMKEAVKRSMGLGKSVQTSRLHLSAPRVVATAPKVLAGVR